MRIHYLQHVPFEDIGMIAGWAKKKGHPVSGTRLYLSESLPAVDAFEVLVVMGGPMNIYEEKEYPWLTKEKKFIGQTIVARKYVIGICLGAQLISDVLGGRVTRNRYKEIGWFPVKRVSSSDGFLRESRLPQDFMAFHWHGDTFDLPAGAECIMSSEACQNQAFVYKNRVLALQFHLEIESEGVQRLLDNCSDDLQKGPYVQSKEEILKGCVHSKKINGVLEDLLEGFIKSRE